MLLFCSFFPVVLDMASDRGEQWLIFTFRYLQSNFTGRHLTFVQVVGQLLFFFNYQYKVEHLLSNVANPVSTPLTLFPVKFQHGLHRQ